jgi:hypothetical protein
MMPRIDMQSLRFALLAGAAIGAIIGMVSSQPLSASGITADVPATPSCRVLCESMTWLRAPVRYRR